LPIDVGLVLKPWGRQCYDAILSKELLDQQPFAARAQPVKTHLLAILTHIDAVDRTTGQQARYWTAFFNQLRDLGYEEAAIWPRLVIPRKSTPNVPPNSSDVSRSASQT